MIHLDARPRDAYLEWVAASGTLFDSPAWARVLEQGLGARVAYLWDDSAGLGHVLATFRRGPFAIGYLGFPLCMDARARARTYGLDDMLQAVLTMRRPPDLVRIPVSAFGCRQLSRPSRGADVAESCIDDLAAWGARATPQRRRYLSVASRKSQALAATRDLEAGEMLRVYRAAVARNRGSFRYGQAYFSALGAMDRQSLQASGLRDNTGRLLSMVISVRHGAHACYLHGGTLPEAMGLGAADLLMAASIGHAQAEGASTFNFLPSPLGQPGLTRFKEKWGGQTRVSRTHEVAAGFRGRLLSGLLSLPQSFAVQTKATSA